MMIKKWLFPHLKNNYHPYILRPLGLVLVLLAVALQPLLYNVTAKHSFQVLGYATDMSTSVLYSLTNQERASAGIGALAVNSALAAAAQNKAQAMFAKDYWAHVSPDGVQPWTFITNAGYSYSAAGENLAKDFDTSGGVMTGWMNSGEHKGNILNPAYKDVGIAVMNGTLLGSTTTLVVAMYGAPVASVAPAAAPAVATPPPAAKSAAPAVSAAPTTQAQPNQPVATPSPQPADVKTKPSTTSHQSSTPATNNSTQKPGVLSWIGSSPVMAVITNLNSLNWGQRVTVFLLSTLVLVNLLKHTIVWRAQKRGWRHIWLRAHPLLQLSLLLVAIMATLTSSYGVVL